MRKYATLLVSLLVLAVGGVAVASCPGPVHYSVPVRHRQHFVQPYYAPYVAPVYVPVYRISYNSETAELLQAVKELRTTVQSLQLQSGAGLSGQQVLSTSCISCHGFKTADEKGNGFYLFNEDGSPLKFSRNDAKRIFARITHSDPAKRMPPGKTLEVPALESLRKYLESVVE